VGVGPTGKKNPTCSGSENSALDQSAILTRQRECNSILILKTQDWCVSVCVFAGGDFSAPRSC